MVLVIVLKWKNGKLGKYYFLENNIMLMNYEEGDGSRYGATRYEKNGKQISIPGETIVLSDDYEIISNSDSGFKLQRNENYKYDYNPVQNKTYKIYSNAFYASETTDNIILTFEETIQYDDYFDDDYPFADMETVGTVVSEDGKQITYGGNVYTLVE